MSESGFEIFTTYGRLILLLVCTMLVVALLVNPVLACLVLRRNPYPVVLGGRQPTGVLRLGGRNDRAPVCLIGTVLLHRDGA